MSFIIEEKQLFKYEWHHSYPAVRSWLSEDIDRLLCWPLWPLLRLAALWPCTHVDLFGMNSDVKNFAGANYLTIAMPGPAQMQLVKQLQGREKLWTELNCVQSVSLSVDLLARQNSHLSFNRLLLPISIAGNWHHQPPWDVAMSENVVHFIFFFSNAWVFGLQQAATIVFDK